MQKRYINYGDFRKIISWYTFFSVGPRVVLGMALPFFIFIFLMLRFPTFIRNTFRITSLETVLIALLAFCGIISSYLAENVAISFRPTFNFLYWQILLLFLYNNRNYLPWDKIIRFAFYGIVSLLIFRFFLQPFLPRQPFLNAHTKNGLAFMVICYAPIALLHVQQRYNNAMVYITAGLFMLAGIINGSRAGFGILAVQLIIVLYVLNFKRISLLFGILVVSGVLLFYQFKQPIGQVLYSINPEYGELVLEEDILNRDVSYLIRKAQQIKSRAIFEEHPYFGIGLLNFSRLPFKFKNNFDGANYVIYKDFVDKMETHNSYLTILTELGGLAFVLFCLLMIITLLKYIRRVHEKHFGIHVFFISFLGMLTHFYLINSIVNSFVWFTMGIIIAFINRSKKLKPI